MAPSATTTWGYLESKSLHEQGGIPMESRLWPAARDFSEAIQNPFVSFVDPELKATTPVTDRLGMPLVAAGQFAYVFKLKAQDGAALAVR